MAAELVRLNRNIAVLKEGVEQIIAGKQFILAHEGPFGEQNKAQERKRDRSAKWDPLKSDLITAFWLPIVAYCGDGKTRADFVKT